MPLESVWVHSIVSAFVSIVHCCAVWQEIHANVRKVGASDNVILVAVVTVSGPGHMYQGLFLHLLNTDPDPVPCPAAACCLVKV